MKKAVLSFEKYQPKRTPLVEGGVYEYKEAPAEGLRYYFLCRTSSDTMCLIGLMSGNRFKDPVSFSRMEDILQDFVLVSKEINISLC